MPRIPGELRDSVIYIYPDVESARLGKPAGGSGFIVGVKSETLPRRYWTYAVTNRHVVQGSGPTPIIRQNVEAGGRTILAVRETRSESWHFHCDLDDVAIVRIHLEPFMVALRGKPGWQIVPTERRDTLARFKSSFVAEERLVTKDLVDELDIGPGDDVFTIGRFFSHEGREQNQPALRFGNISMMPEPIEQEGSGLKQESFIVECRSIAGFSGSPVWVHIPPLSYSRRHKRTAPESWWRGPWLLGVDWGHLRIPEGVVDPGGKKHSEDLRVFVNSGMMGVVPAWKVKELLQQNEVIKQRKEAEAEYSRRVSERAAAGSSAAAGDGVESTDPSGAEDRERPPD